MLQGFKHLLRLQSKILRNSRAASTVMEQIDFASRQENITQPVKLLTDAESFRFQSYLPQILEDIGSLPGVESMPDITEWLNETIQAIVTHGDFIAAHQTILAYKYLSQDQADFDLAIVNGWAIELGLRGHEILEDVIDDTKVRNGKDTWHSRNKHEVAAVCDGILVRSSTALLSQKYFKTKSYYSDMITLRNFNTHSQLYGKSLVLKNTKERQFHLFSNQLRYKLDFYTRVKSMMLQGFFYQPVISSMLMTGYKDPRLLQNVKAITNLVGIVHSAKTDLVGTTYHPEKFEQNIVNGMCTWQLAMALEYAPWEDRKILLENYGSSKAENIEEVKGVYEKMELHKMYAQWEEEKCHDISDLVAQLPVEDLQTYFSHVSSASFGRNF